MTLKCLYCGSIFTGPEVVPVESGVVRAGNLTLKCTRCDAQHGIEIAAIKPGQVITLPSKTPT